MNRQTGNYNWQRFLAWLAAMPVRRAREAAENETDTREAAENADAVTADGWFMVSPYGIFPGKTRGRQQNFGKREAEAMVSEFNSLRGRARRLFTGLPIFIGHPDVDPDRWKDERRLGKITELQARDDGMWALPAWNALGRDNIENGYWVYPSPHWDAPAGMAEFRPDRLISVGLTNFPRITASEAVTNAREPATADPSGETGNETEEPTNDTTDMDRQKLIQALGLAAEATDEEILNAIASLQERSDKAEEEMANTAKEKADTEAARLQAEKERDAAAAERDKARDEQANSIIDFAIAAGRLTEADRAHWKGQFATDREAAANAITALKPAIATKALDLSASRAACTGHAEAREKIENAVHQLMERDKIEDYTEAWCRVKREGKLAAEFERIGQGGSAKDAE